MLLTLNGIYYVVLKMSYNIYSTRQLGHLSSIMSAVNILWTECLQVYANFSVSALQFNKVSRALNYFYGNARLLHHGFVFV